MITYIIIGITSLFSILAFQNQDLFNKHVFNPYIIKRNKEWHRFFTHALLHADWMHLILNMYVLYIFGKTLEDNYFRSLFDSKAGLNYALLYVGGVLISSFPSFEKHKDNGYYNAVGASGAVSAVLFSSIVINPVESRIGLMFLPPSLWPPAYVFGILYLLYSWYMAKRGGDNIGHDAHFWGAVFGVVFTIILKPALALHFIQQIIG